MLLLLAIPAISRGADEIDKLVRRRLSPGAVALLVRHTRDPRIAARLKSALADENGGVRGAAARVVAVGAMAGLLSDLKEVLSKETDADAAQEQIRALCAIGGQATDPEALTAAGRFAPRLDGSTARLLARLRGAENLTLYFTSLRGLKLSQSDRKAFFRHLVNRSGPDVLAVAGSMAISNAAVKDWEAVLAVAAEREAPLDQGVLIAALRGEEPVFRGEAAWYMAKTYRRKPPENPERILEAVSDEKAPSSDPEQRFGAEILRRVLGKPAVEDESWIACLDTNPNCHLDSDFIESPLVELLTERERVALLRRNEAHRPPEARSSRNGPRSNTGGPARRPARIENEEGERIDLRLVSGLPKGTSEDLLSVGGCRSNVRVRWYSVADIEFGPHGLPQHVRLLGASSDQDCQRTAETIFLMAAAPDDGDAGSGRGTYLSLFDTECLICGEESAPLAASGAKAEVVRVRAKVVAPKLEKKVEPFYPLEARKQLQEGVSIYEAIISTTGCVRQVRLLKSSYPILDMVGMEAIARWRYRPAMLDERPIPVYLTVTVTYNLRK
jgi:TonB family protein